MLIIYLPYEVTLADADNNGNDPFTAPVNPYTEFALIFIANCLPSRTAFLNGSVYFANNYLVFFRAAINYYKIIGNIPFLKLDFTNQSLFGVV